MAERPRDPAGAQLIPAYGLLLGVGVGVLLAALDVTSFAWGLLAGGAIGLLIGVGIWAMSQRR